MNNTKTSRTIYLDILRVASMFGVILLHVLAGPLRSNYNSTTWHISNILSALATVSVPIFFMISGALILSSNHTLNLQYVWKNRILRIAVPFIIWSIIAILTYTIHDGRFSVKLVLGYIALLPGRYAAPALWFMYPLLVLYIISPALKYMIDAMPRQILRYLLYIWLIVSVILPTIAGLMSSPFNRIFTLTADWNFVSGYLGYFLLGYYLYTAKKTIKNSFIYPAIIAIIVLISYETHYLTNLTGIYDERGKGYLSILVVLLSVLCFLLAKNHGNNYSQNSKKITTFLSPLSYGVYLIHNLFVLVITAPLFNLLHLSLLVFIPINFVVVSSFSIFSIWIFTKIPGLSLILTGLKKD